MFLYMISLSILLYYLSYVISFVPTYRMSSLSNIELNIIVDFKQLTVNLL